MTIKVEKMPQTLNNNYAKTHYENNETDMTRKAAVCSAALNDVNDEKPPKYIVVILLDMANISS
jgi:hypothetical protein